MRRGVVLVYDFSDDVRATHAHVVAEHKPATRARKHAACKSRDEHKTVFAFGVVLRTTDSAEKIHKARIHQNDASRVERKAFVEHEKRDDKEGNIHQNRQNAGIKKGRRKCKKFRVVRLCDCKVNDRRKSAESARSKAVGIDENVRRKSPYKCKNDEHN